VSARTWGSTVSWVNTTVDSLPRLGLPRARRDGQRPAPWGAATRRRIKSCELEPSAGFKRPVTHTPPRTSGRAAVKMVGTMDALLCSRCLGYFSTFCSLTSFRDVRQHGGLWLCGLRFVPYLHWCIRIIHPYSRQCAACHRCDRRYHRFPREELEIHQSGGKQSARLILIETIASER
jgi:hypothetical protein